MSVGIPDLKRLVSEMVAGEEIGPQEMEGWLDDEQIEQEALEFLIEKMCGAFIACVGSGEFSVPDALSSTVATAFQMGWCAHKQYGVLNASTDPRGDRHGDEAS